MKPKKELSDQLFESTSKLALDIKDDSSAQAFLSAFKQWQDADKTVVPRCHVSAYLYNSASPPRPAAPVGSVCGIFVFDPQITQEKPL